MTFTVHNLERLSLAGMIEFVEGNRGVRFAVRGVVQVGNGNLGQPLVIGVAENLEFALQECRTAGPDRSSWPC